MGGSAKAPKASDEQRKNEALSAELMKVQLKQAKTPIVLPDVQPLKPVPPPPPPAMLSQDAAQAAEDARRKAAARTNTSRNTIFAGDTGNKAPKTLLG